MFILYKHTCPNGKVYIGITCQNASRRWRKGLGYEKNTYFWRAIQKYGWENIKHEILFDGLTKAEACQKEVELIQQFDSTNPNKGYNISKGGEHPRMSDITKLKLSVAKRGKPSPTKGKKMDNSTYEKVKKTMFKKGCSIRVGMHHTPETKRKMSEAKKGKRCRKIQQFDLQGNFIREWQSIKEAGEVLTLPTSNIIFCCQHKIKKVKNYKFEYIN